MNKIEKWIWLDQKKWPDDQTSILNAFCDPAQSRYTVAEFRRTYTFDQEIAEAVLRFSGDTDFTLWLNGEVLCTGPVNVGGDFLFNDSPRSRHYASTVTIHPGTDRMEFFARVRMTPVLLSEYSRGHGGFMLSGRITLKDGSVRWITTDTSWQGRKNGAYAAPDRYDGHLDTGTFAPAQVIDNIWHCDDAPIRLRTEEMILPLDHDPITLAPGEKRAIRVEFDRIYGGFVYIGVASAGEVYMRLSCVETDVSVGDYELRFRGNDAFRGPHLNSIGEYVMNVENRSDAPAQIIPRIIATCYPVFGCADIRTSDEELNQVLDVCRHTLKYCRQTIHLDSPKHSEPLACTGDYYIESLMTAMSFGDMDLAKFDIERTAELLRVHDGRMFHTTYSLIWVMMLWDVYMITGDIGILTGCEDALHLLLDRFRTYIGTNGLIETPPDYMFVDWIYVDDISMHHPPKALGQTCLCAFYYGALNTAAKVYHAIGDEADAAACEKHAVSLRSAMNTHLFDREKGIYFDGLNTPTPDGLLGEYMPQNVEKRYYMPHSNILCACFGVCDDTAAIRIIDKLMTEPEWCVCQPYFKHFLLEAVYRLGLREKYTLAIIEDWKAPVQDCPKGLVEGFVQPEPTYSFDHSHAWGGTPLYSLPKALLGLEIIRPGYAEYRLDPCLLGLKNAHVEVPTPRGMIAVDMDENGIESQMVPTEWLQSC